jgi:hypothetical protein
MLRRRVRRRAAAAAKTALPRGSGERATHTAAAGLTAASRPDPHRFGKLTQRRWALLHLLHGAIG